MALKIPAVRILSPSVELVGYIDAYSSLMFKRSWQGVGEFQLVATYKAGADKLIKGQLIMLGSDGHRAGIITGITAAQSVDGVTVTATGTALDGLASRRITLPDNDAYNGGYDNVPPLTASVSSPSPVSAETILKTYADRHMVSPTDTKRKIPRLVLAPDLTRGRPAVWMSRLEPLNEVLQAVSEYTDTGWEVYIDLPTKQLVFDVRTGVDRSWGQSENSRIIFSQDYDNISAVSYKYDSSALKNIGYAGGAGENESRIILKVTNDDTEPEGLDRREIFLDCGNLEIVETATTMSLAEEGRHKLKDYPETEAVNATAVSDGYLTRWDLGDKVTVVSKKTGFRFDTHITEITERYESGNAGIDITVGAPSPDLGRTIRQLNKGVIR